MTGKQYYLHIRQEISRQSRKFKVNFVFLGFVFSFHYLRGCNLK